LPEAERGIAVEEAGVEGIPIKVPAIDVSNIYVKINMRK